MILSYTDFILEKKNPCWSGYTQVGTKKKKGRKVPNCVPVNEDIIEPDRASFYLNYYKNLSPSGFGVERYGNSIVISVPEITTTIPSIDI
jgi:hypothetical protein